MYTENNQTDIKKKVIVFVGSFRPMAEDGTIGGQMFACQSLLESPLSSLVEWRLIDSTMKSLPPPNVLIRASYALKRLLMLMRYIFFGSVDGVLIFSPYVTSSMIEKGLMCILASFLRKTVVLSLRSEISYQSSDRHLKYYTKKIIESTRAVICQSDIAAENLVQSLGCTPSNIVVIPNWINSEIYKWPEPDGSLFQVSHDHPILLFVGWLEQYKGVNELIDAARLLLEEGLSFRLVLCGSGSLRESLEKRCTQYGLKRHVEFRGWVSGEAKINAFREADIFVLPSFSEGLPNALLEAMASGLAVVATPVGGISSIIESGNNGVLVKPRDHVSLAQGIRELLLDPAQVKRMGRINRKKISQAHDIEQAWRKVAKVLCVEVPENWSAI